jgi:PhzF family phenazine biosynthesis protein
MSTPIFQVDAFTNQQFSGNPAGVCLLDKPRPAEWMQAVAREMNLSETAFLQPNSDGYHLRWFTPKVEVELCGHATLASAHILFEGGYLDRAKVARFHTLSGVLTAGLKEGWIEMDFPATPVTATGSISDLEDSLSMMPLYTGKSQFDYFVEVPTEAQVRGLVPDMQKLAALAARGVIVTARSSGRYDFISRFFAPAVGVDEDPVTGSAHCTLGPYWSEKLGKPSLFAYQASSRGGEVGVTVQGDRVLLRGQAVTIFKGELCEN